MCRWPFLMYFNSFQVVVLVSHHENSNDRNLFLHSCEIIYFIPEALNYGLSYRWDILSFIYSIISDSSDSYGVIPYFSNSRLGVEVELLLCVVVLVVFRLWFFSWSPPTSDIIFYSLITRGCSAKRAKWLWFTTMTS